MKTVGPGDDPFVGGMERALDVMSRRQQLLASNIGNVDTPGYRTQDIDFSAALQRATRAPGRGLLLRTADPRHVAVAAHAANVRPAPVEGLTVRNDGNDVSIDREMLALAETRGRFESTTTFARFRIKQLLSAIEDGRGA